MRLRLTWDILLKSGLIWVTILAGFYFFFWREGKGDSYMIIDKDAVDVVDTNNLIKLELKKQIPSDKSSLAQEGPRWQDDLPIIYMVTPTYRRAEQIPELTRTAQTLMHVKNLVWIVVEDAPQPSQPVLNYLQHSGLKYVYLRAEMPVKFAKDTKKPRGVANRNAAMQWVRKNATSGVVYFGDDDNTYDLRIFEEIRYTKKVSMFPVGLVTRLGVSTPIVKNGKVIGFYDGWIASRKFPVDMAGFAINVQVFLDHPDALMPFSVGYEEDGLLKNLKIKTSDIEPKAANCTEIWVWHTQTKKNEIVKDSPLKASLQNTNLSQLRKQLWRGT
ncbi:UNVERIFIED_CONTAM: hypothetical protein RMT77_000486 [Armadillidium vulgare]